MTCSTLSRAGVGEFIEDRCDVGAGYEVAVDDLFTAWVTRCSQTQIRPGDKGQFGKRINAAINVGTARRGPRGAQHKVYVGLRLKPAYDPKAGL